MIYFPKIYCNQHYSIHISHDVTQKKWFWRVWWHQPPCCDFSTGDLNYLSLSSPLLMSSGITTQSMTQEKVKTRGVRCVQHNTCSSQSVPVQLPMTYMSLVYIQYSDLWYWHHPRGESLAAVCGATCWPHCVQCAREWTMPHCGTRWSLLWWVGCSNP
jgi:hypothetical protein